MGAARTIQIKSAPVDEGCGGAEPFALMVLGDAMAPEFVEGDVVVAEPDGHAVDGAFVIAFAQGEWFFRRLVAEGAGWRLEALDARYPPIGIESLEVVRGVVIQRSTPGKRRANKTYGV